MTCFNGNKKAKEPVKISFIGRATNRLSCFGCSDKGSIETSAVDNNAETTVVTTRPGEPESSDALNTRVRPSRADAERAEFGLKELYHGGADAEVDIVAVHGLNGNREKTFTADNGVCWLNSLLPEVMPKIRVFSYGYDARTHSSSPLSSDHLLGHAEDFLETFTMRRDLTETTKRPIIFVAHSLGGIIVKSVLNLSASRNASHRVAQRGIKLSTYGILFMGTPHRGGEGVPWAKLALNIVSVARYTNPEILGHLQQNSEWLENQQTMYLPISSHFDTTYFYERYPTVVAGTAIIIVPKYSAYLGLTDAGVMAINSDHRNMVKFGNRDDEGFQRVSGTLQIMFRKAQGKINENWQIEEAVNAIGKAQKVSYLVPMKLPFQKNHNFTGRKQELSEIHALLQGPDVDHSNTRVVVLHGLGGMGKTQLATEYAYLHAENYTSIWWVNAKTIDSLADSFVEIAQELIAHHARIRVHTGQKPDYAWIATALGISPDSVDPKGQLKPSPASIELIVDAVKSWLVAGDNKKWLLIIDNYDNLEDVDTRKFIPTNASGNVIITTRAIDTRRLGRSVEVAEVGEKDALEILRKSAQTELTAFESQRDDALVIVKRAGALPLALDQAGAFISAMGIPYSEYIVKFDAKFRELAANRPPTSVWQYGEDTVFTTWEISFNSLGPDAQQLLMLCAFLDNEDIWEGLFSVESGKIGIESLNYAIREIFALSLAKRKSLQGSFWVHPMVHRWSYERLDIKKKELKASDAISLTSAAVSFARSASPKALDNLALERRLLPHIMACCAHVQNGFLEPVAGSVEKQIDVDTLQRVLQYHYRLPQAELLAQWGLAASTTTLGLEHYNTLSSMHALAWVFETQGKYSEALIWYAKALAGRERLLGMDHADTITTVHNMGLALENQGKYDAALVLYQRALAVLEVTHGDDEITLTTVCNMGWIFTRQGKYDDALLFSRRALVGRERILGKDHPDTLASVNNIGQALCEQQKYDEALECYQRALSGWEKTLGRDHPTTLTAVHNIGGIFSHQGKYELALEFYDRALTGRETILGKDHPDTLSTIHDLAYVSNETGRYDQALELYARVLAVPQTADALGDSHPDTLSTLNNMALVYDKLKRYDDALDLYLQALEGRERVLGKEHPETLTTVYNISLVYENQGRYDQALGLYERELAGRDNITAEDDPGSLMTVNRLVMVCVRLGNYVDALKWCTRLLAAREKGLGVDHNSTLATVNNMAWIYDQQGKYEDALEGYKRVLAAVGDPLGKSGTLVTEERVAAVLYKLGRYDEAYEQFREVVAKKELTMDRDNPSTLNTAFFIAVILHTQERYDDALEWYQRAFQGRETVLGNDNPDTLAAMSGIASVYKQQEKYEEALEWYQRVLTRRESGLGNEHPDTVATRAIVDELRGRSEGNERGVD